MKKQAIIIPAVRHNAEVEKLIEASEVEIKEQAQKLGRHFAGRNLPAPLGDRLSHYTGEIKAKCERLAADIARITQPSAHIPEGKLDHEHAKETDASIAAEIQGLENQNSGDSFQLQDYHPGNLLTLVRSAMVVAVLLSAGEVVFNTMSFQVMVENLLFALILAISLTVGIVLFSHLIPMMYKKAKTTLQKRMVILGSFSFITGVFIAFASLRSKYLASHNVLVNPIYFVIINLFFFIVSVLFSYFVLPTIQEYKQDRKKRKLFETINKRRQSIKDRKGEQALLKTDLLQRHIQRIGIINNTNYSNDTTRAIYLESIEKFKITNLIYRSDGRAPDCFSDPIPPLDVYDFEITIPPLNRKLS